MALFLTVCLLFEIILLKTGKSSNYCNVQMIEIHVHEKPLTQVMKNKGNIFGYLFFFFCNVIGIALISSLEIIYFRDSGGIFPFSISLNHEYHFAPCNCKKGSELNSWKIVLSIQMDTLLYTCTQYMFCKIQMYTSNLLRSVLTSAWNRS